MDNLRIVEVLRDEKWERILFEELVKGDLFKIYDLVPVTGTNGATEFKAAADPRVTDEGFLTIDIEYLNMVEVDNSDNVIDVDFKTVEE